MASPRNVRDNQTTEKDLAPEIERCISEHMAKMPLPKDGKDGSDGMGIATAVISGGHLVLTYSDGSTHDLGQVVGSNGVGIQGTAGATWTTGTGTPSSTAAVGDLYLDTSNGDVWKMN